MCTLYVKIYRLIHDTGQKLWLILSFKGFSWVLLPSSLPVHAEDIKTMMENMLLHLYFENHHKCESHKRAKRIQKAKS